MHNFKQLAVWQRSIKLANHVIEFSNSLTLKNQQIFTLQLSRCAISIPSNIAEGAGKNSTKDFCRYLDIAAGSSFELETQLIIIQGIQPEKAQEIDLILSELMEIQKMIFGLIKSLKQKIK